MWQAIAGAGMGLVTDAIAADRQKNIQKDLTNEQVKGAMKLGDYNQELAMKTWRDTNYAAQRREMEKAGLNPGLMYAQGGSGGTTQGGSVAMPTGGQAPTESNVGMGLQMGLNAMMQKAQIDLAKSQAQNLDADTQTKLGQPGVQEAGRQKTIAEIGNEVLKGTGIELENAIKKIQLHVQDNTASDNIEAISQALRKATAEADSAEAKGTVDKETVQEAIQIMRQTATEQQVRIAAAKMGMKVNEAQIKELGAAVTKTLADNEREWERMSYEDREIRIKQKAQEIAKQVADFNTGGEAQVGRWADIISKMLGAMPKK